MKDMFDSVIATDNELMIPDDGQEQEVVESTEEEPVENSAEEVDIAAQSEEDNRRFAALRRNRERQEELDKIRSDEKRAAQEKVDRAYAEAFRGQTNPFTGTPIASEADYNTYVASRRAQSEKERLVQLGLDPEVLNRIIDEHPTVAKAREAYEMLSAEKERVHHQQAKNALDVEVKRISAIDPDIRTVEDLANMPNAGVFHSLVERGNSLIDAFKLANFDRLKTMFGSAAKQSVRNNINSKSHLSTTDSRGSGGVEVPPETLQMYRRFFPNGKEEEFKNHYAGCLKK